MTCARCNKEKRPRTLSVSGAVTNDQKRDTSQEQYLETVKNVSCVRCNNKKQSTQETINSRNNQLKSVACVGCKNIAHSFTDPSELSL